MCVRYVVYNLNIWYSILARYNASTVPGSFVRYRTYGIVLQTRGNILDF